MRSVFARRLFFSPVPTVHNMTAASSATHPPEFPDILGLLAEVNHRNSLGQFLHHWGSVLYTLAIIGLLTYVAYQATRRREYEPGRLQSAIEFLVTFVEVFLEIFFGIFFSMKLTHLGS